jgi:hypothetical protein
MTRSPVLGLSPITGTIYCGRLSKKNKYTWSGQKHDVTSNFISVMLQKFEPGYEHEITVDGKARYKVTVKEIEGEQSELDCEWTEDDDGSWNTQCGQKFTWTVGGPFDNRARWCLYCGKKLKEVKN